MKIISYACTDRKCGWGNWGKKKPSGCPMCGKPLTTLQVIKEVDLDHAVSTLRRTIRSDQDKVALS
jgi:hypothetical protein